MESSAKNRYTEGIGRRKRAVARVRLVPASRDSLLINDKDAKTYFPTDELRSIVEQVKTVAGSKNKYAVTARITGGGIHAQAEALAHGWARALVAVEQETRSPLKKSKLLTRDAREKERRKFGLKKARKAPQWSKR